MGNQRVLQVSSKTLSTYCICSANHAASGVTIGFAHGAVWACMGPTISLSNLQPPRALVARSLVALGVSCGAARLFCGNESPEFILGVVGECLGESSSNPSDSAQQTSPTHEQRHPGKREMRHLCLKHLKNEMHACQMNWEIASIALNSLS